MCAEGIWAGVPGDVIGDPSTLLDQVAPRDSGHQNQHTRASETLRSTSNVCGSHLHFPGVLHPTLSQAVTKGSDLGAVLAFMSIVHVDQNIVQGILSAIPGKCSALAKRFGGKSDEQ
jgi:hypothetical protein